MDLSNVLLGRKLGDGFTCKIVGVGELLITAVLESDEETKVVFIPQLVPREIRKEETWIRWDGKRFVLATCPNT